ncbi:DMT family transporter [Demequina sp. NBRC 110057]|uniref:EamA family transporter n=1 Tax=Demequina sp. NBRC 110057 TaxID=1570346 RepID=UPI000A024452|nr:EamA family transporter [Demequina sp. NBRC 110057]
MTADARTAGMPLLVVLGLVCQEAGAAVAVNLMPDVGPWGVIAMRLAFSAVVLLPLAVVSLRRGGAIHWPTVVAFGVALAGMNAFFYLALERIPLGITVTIEVLGPLVLSVVASRSWQGLLWAALAAAGVILLGGGAHDLDLLGVLFAAGAAVMWAAYILTARAAGAAMPGVVGLALAMVVGSVLTLPVAGAVVGAALLQPHALALGLAVAVLSSAIPYGIELSALRRMKAETFAILLALAPAIAALAGLVLLDQRLTWAVAAGIGLVTIAGVGAVISAGRRAVPASEEAVVDVMMDEADQGPSSRPDQGSTALD